MAHHLLMFCTLFSTRSVDIVIMPIPVSSRNFTNVLHTRRVHVNKRIRPFVPTSLGNIHTILHLIQMFLRFQVTYFKNQLT